VRRVQRGMSLVVAIFLIVVIAVLSALAVSLGTAASGSTSLQLQADRALAAARAGIEWGAYRALVQGSCVGSTPLNLNQSVLNGFTVTVTCTRSNHNEGAVNYSVFDVTAFAQSGNFGEQDYASRRLVSRFSNAP
jgi:MSHA biogenesis protein MshP